MWVISCIQMKAYFCKTVTKPKIQNMWYIVVVLGSVMILGIPTLYPSSTQTPKPIMGWRCLHVDKHKPLTNHILVEYQIVDMEGH